ALGGMAGEGIFDAGRGGRTRPVPREARWPARRAVPAAQGSLRPAGCRGAGHWRGCEHPWLPRRDGPPAFHGGTREAAGAVEPAVSQPLSLSGGQPPLAYPSFFPAPFPSAVLIEALS